MSPPREPRVAEVRTALAALLAELDHGQAISLPVSWVRALLDHEADGDDILVDLTVAEVAEMFGRHENTIRGWLQSGELRGYKFQGKEWRVPRAAVREFQQRQAEGDEVVEDASPNDLGAWRRARS